MVYLQRVKRNMIRGLMAGLVILVLMLIANSSSNTYQSSNSINFLAVPFVLVWFGLIAFGFTRPYPTDKRKITIILLSVSTSIVVFGYLYCFVMFPSAFQVPPDWNFFDKIGVSLMFIVPIIFCALYQYLSPIRKESDVKEAGLEKGEIIEERILQNPKVKQFYENTMTAWANGKDG